MITEPLKKLMEDVPPKELAETADSVLVDYAISSVLDQQSESPEKAVSNIRLLKRIRDAFCSSCKGTAMTTLAALSLVACKSKSVEAEKRRAETIVDSLITVKLEYDYYKGSILRKDEIADLVKAKGDTFFYFDPIDIQVQKDMGKSSASYFMQQFNRWSFTQQRLTDEFVQLSKKLPDTITKRLAMQYQYNTKMLDEMKKNDN